MKREVFLVLGTQTAATLSALFVDILMYVGGKGSITRFILPSSSDTGNE